MKYYEVNFNIEAPAELMQDARDILSALAGEAGFETFEDTDTGVKGYVQQALFDEDCLKTLIGEFPLPSCSVSFDTTEAEDKDWNEQWEHEGFEPIVVGDAIVIHNGRHLPENQTLISIEIDTHLAFGTGTHETTRMMVSQLMSLELDGKQVLDCGSGTGILAIAALKLGANKASNRQVVARQNSLDTIGQGLGFLIVYRALRKMINEGQYTAHDNCYRCKHQHHIQ